MDIISKKAIKISDEERIDDIGQRYRATKWNYQGYNLEINVDIDDNDRPMRYHARANGKHTRSNMDEGGLVGWFKSLFEGE